MAYQPPPKRTDLAETPRSNNMELSGLIGDLRNLSIFAPGASGYQNLTNNPVDPIQQAPVMSHYQPAFNRNLVNVSGNQHLIGGDSNTNGHQPTFDRDFINLQQGNQHLVSGNPKLKEQLPGFQRNFTNVPGNPLPIVSKNMQFENGHQPGFDRNFGNVPRMQHLIGGNSNTNGHQPGFDHDFINLQQDNQNLVGGNSNADGHQPAFNCNFGNVASNQPPIVSTNNQFGNGNQPGFNSNFGNVPSIQHLIGGNSNTKEQLPGFNRYSVNVPGNPLPIVSSNMQFENGHQPGFDRDFINLQQGSQQLVSGNSNTNGHQPGFDRNFINVPGNLLSVVSNKNQVENGQQPSFNRSFVEVQGNQHLIGGNANPNGHQPGLNRNFVNVPGNQLPIVSNKMQFENGHQPGFNRSFDSVPRIEHLIGGNPNTNAYGGADHSYSGPRNAEATGKILNHTSKQTPKDHRDQNQFSKVGSVSKNTFLFPHLPSSLLRESCTDDTVLIPYQMSAAKFLLCTAPHMFQIGIGNVIDMVDQWDNPVPQLTGTFQFGDSIWSNNAGNEEK